MSTSMTDAETATHTDGAHHHQHQHTHQHHSAGQETVISGAGSGGPVQHSESSNGSSEKGNHNGYGSGSPVSRALTPGGHNIDNSMPGFPVYHRRFANPAPLGLLSFANTTLLLSFFLVGARGVTVPNVFVGNALWVGGLCQFLAGMWEFAAGNTFGATVFTTFGCFWPALAANYIPKFGIIAAYASVPGSLDQALGIWLYGFFIVTFFFWLATFRSSVALSIVLFLLVMAFALLAAGNLTGSASTAKAGGIFGIILGFWSFYTGAAILLDEENTGLFQLPVIDLSRKEA